MLVLSLRHLVSFQLQIKKEQLSVVIREQAALIEDATLIPIKIKMKNCTEVYISECYFFYCVEININIFDK